MKIEKYQTTIKENIFLEFNMVRESNFPNRFENKLINIYPDITYQEIIGFGGAITESAGYSYGKLSQEKKKRFINDYFSQSGLNYSLARLPIGSCDFSLNSYSYSNKSDLSDFTIERDKEYIIPLLRAADTTRKLKLLSSPWSPPKFMKNTKFLYLRWKTNSKVQTNIS